MRIFLLPISTRRTLIYCERMQTQLAGVSPPVQDRIVNKVATTWASWEKHEKGWQKKVTVYGNQMFRRIPFEEWGLKSMPTASEKRMQEASSGEVKYECLYPAAFVSEGKVSEILSKLAVERQELHRKRMAACLIFAPFTIPFALVPVIPNLPFFYLMFRAYSHYKAFSGSKMLQHLTSNKLIKATPSTQMDERYAAGLIHRTQAEARTAKPDREEIEYIARDVDIQTDGGKAEVKLLESWNGTLIAEDFELPEMEIEIERAAWQVEQAIEKSKIEAIESRGKEADASTTNSNTTAASTTSKDEKR